MFAIASTSFSILDADRLIEITGHRLHLGCRPSFSILSADRLIGMHSVSMWPRKRRGFSILSADRLIEFEINIKIGPTLVVSVSSLRID